MVAVRRSRDFVGTTVEGGRSRRQQAVGEVRDLVARIDLAAAAWPDMYSYVFVRRRRPSDESEQHLTPELRRLAELVLDPTR